MSELDRAELLEEIKEIIDLATNGRIDVIEISEEMRLVEDVGLYSLDLLDVRYEIENKYHFKLSDDEVASLLRINDVIDVIIKYRKLS